MGSYLLGSSLRKLQEKVPDWAGGFASILMLLAISAICIGGSSGLLQADLQASARVADNLGLQFSLDREGVFYRYFTRFVDPTTSVEGALISTLITAMLLYFGLRINQFGGWYTDESETERIGFFYFLADILKRRVNWRRVNNTKLAYAAVYFVVALIDTVASTVYHANYTTNLTTLSVSFIYSLAADNLFSEFVFAEGLYAFFVALAFIIHPISLKSLRDNVSKAAEGMGWFPTKRKDDTGVQGQPRGSQPNHGRNSHRPATPEMDSVPLSPQEMAMIQAMNMEPPGRLQQPARPTPKGQVLEGHGRYNANGRSARR